MKKLIGFSGGYGVGKSTAIQLLKEAVSYGTPFRLVKFAQPLYDIQEMVYNRISSVYERPADFKKDRTLLQWLGTDWGRGTISESLWIDIWRAEAKQRLGLNAMVVCDDCRFDNEAEAIHELGGIVIRITRDDGAKHAEGGTGIQNHASEAGLRACNIDYTIANNGSLEDFKNSLSKLYKQLAAQSE